MFMTHKWIHGPWDLRSMAHCQWATDHGNLEHRGETWMRNVHVNHAC